MIKNYFKIAFRNLVRHKAYTTINVLGLALGMTCGILIFALVSFHLSFDNFHADSDRIYRFVTEAQREGVSYSRSVPSPLGKVFREDYTFGEKVARIATYNSVLITIEEGETVRKFKEEEGVAFTEPEFFDIFNYPLSQGDSRTALNEPGTAILTERMARKYFGDANPVNRTFRLDNTVDFRVTGVLKELPVNTDRQTEIYLSYVTLKQYNDWLASDDAWGGISSALQCFVRLRPGVSPDEVEQVLPAYVKKYRAESKNVHHYKLQPLSDVHFSSLYEGKAPKPILLALSLIGALLILTACVNFINLATAQALNRAREVGVRKVLGSARGQLFGQFLLETGLITIVAVVLALGCTMLALPTISKWFQAQLPLSFLLNGQFIVFIALLIIAVTFLAGSYPGLILSRFQPVSALKGRVSQRNIGGFNTRRSLIVTQFVISQLLIIGMIIMASQMRYATEADLGFDKDAVVMLPIATGTDIQTRNTLKAQFSGLPGVLQVSLCWAAPLSDNNWNTSLWYDNRSEAENFGISVRSADDQYIPLFGLELAAGRNIFPADTVREFVVNETFVKKLNLQSPHEVIGKMLSINGGTQRGPIVGVVRDFHDRSFLEQINAVCIASRGEGYNSYAVKIDLSNAAATLASLEKTWSDRHPDQVFEHQFLDEQVAEMYEPLALMLRLVEVFAAIAIFIGCLGLYGLVSFMTAQKTNEIGIRKVLGSSVAQILWIFAGEFSRLVVIAFIIASPIAWWTMNQWLQDFAYQIAIEWWMFAGAGLAAMVIALFTVSWQAIKAAIVNPVESLRDE